MCGRFTRQFSWRDLHALMSLCYPQPGELRSSWNVAPTQTTPVCRLDAHGAREIVLMRWGFIPEWSSTPTAGSLHARSETVATRSMFRAAYRSRRCLIPVTSFFEWRTIGGPKRPFLVRLARGDLFCFAGIWERWSGNDRAIDSFAIVTTRPNELVGSIHDRMPVIVRAADYDLWLTGAEPPRSFFDPYPAEEMDMHEVPTRVNDPRNDDATVCERVQSAPGLFDGLP